VKKLRVVHKGAFHHDPILEEKVLHTIKEGRVEDLKEFPS